MTAATIPDDLLTDLAALSPALESDESAWPAEQITRLAKTGVLGWVIPRDYGGLDVSPQELVQGYVRLASACMTTAFVLTQRNGACQRIAGSENDSLRAELLPALCRGDVFATVGISHLTTSRQHLGRPAVRVEEDAGAYVLNGAAPWVTGASHADVIVTGGTCENGRQVLAVVATGKDGVRIHPPPRLLALNASQTGAVEFDDVRIDKDRLIAGPIEQVMKRGTGGGTGSLTTSAVAVGAARGSLRHLERECENRPALSEIYDPLLAECQLLERQLFESAGGETGDAGATIESIRTRANSLVSRAAHAYLTAAKGAGFVAGHPAERAIRESTFFLVWSCPQPVQTAALREFACLLPP
ncbi:MAG: acyl-CoA dehydrogenase family protein [Planctomycetaceae bacterium]